MPEFRTPEPGADAAAIRCRDLAAMTAFYRDIVGLEIIESDHPENAVLLRTAGGFTGPARRIALFAAEDEEDEGDEPVPAPHHLSLVVPGPGELDRADAWFRAHGLEPAAAEYAWAGWKCLTVTDPEGNIVELAAPVRQRTIPAEAVGERGPASS